MVSYKLPINTLEYGRSRGVVGPDPLIVISGGNGGSDGAGAPGMTIVPDMADTTATINACCGSETKSPNAAFSYNYKQY